MEKIENRYLSGIEFSASISGANEPIVVKIKRLSAIDKLAISL
jgi:hypothetical protein